MPASTPIDPAHNPKVAGSNPAPAVQKPPEIGGFRFIRQFPDWGGVQTGCNPAQERGALTDTAGSTRGWENAHMALIFRARSPDCSKHSSPKVPETATIADNRRTSALIFASSVGNQKSL
jgi:hypothetical protein